MIRYFICFIFVSSMVSTSANAQFADEPLIKEQFFNSLEKSYLNGKYLATLVIENFSEGEIYFILGNGSRKPIGKVLVPAVKWSENPFEASEWAPEGVCAVAVNAIHIKHFFSDSGYPPKYVLLSILPKEMLEVDPKAYSSYYRASSSIYTDIPAGTSIFGGLYTPFLGCKVIKEGEKFPSVIKIEYRRPDPLPMWITFENRFGGLIKVKYPGLDEKEVGVVYRPVYGVGRFLGTLYCEIGRIRAVHTGVIDVSTSPVGEIGGFQIVPFFHANTTNVKNIRLLTQWMVIGAMEPSKYNYDKLAEIFRVLQPRYEYLNSGQEINDKDNEVSILMSRIHVFGKFRGESDWKLFSPILGKVDDALESLEMIKIVLPRPETYDDIFK